MYRVPWELFAIKIVPGPVSIQLSMFVLTCLQICITGDFYIGDKIGINVRYLSKGYIMKRLRIVLFLLAVVIMAISLHFSGIFTNIPSKQADMASVALVDLYRYLGNYHEINKSLPMSLDEIPGWADHIAGISDTDLKAMYLRIQYQYAAEDIEEPQKVASVDFADYSVVLDSIGSVYSWRKRGEGKGVGLN